MAKGPLANDLFDQTGLGDLTTPQIDPSKDYLSELVGDGKKFKDVTELAKGKAYSDAHIATLNETLNGLRQELAQRKTTEDLINHINNLAKPQQQTQIDPINQPGPQGEIKAGLTVEDVQRLLADRDVQSQRSFNLNTATQKLKESFGDQAAQMVDLKAKELGISKDYLKGIAEQSPNAFLAMFSGASPPDRPNTIFNAPSQSSYRPQDNKPQGETWKSLNALKQTDPNTYWSPGYQRKLYAAAEKAMADGRYDQFMAE